MANSTKDSRGSGKVRSREQWWLVEIGPHGSPTLSDGPHGERAGVERALYLIQSMRLAAPGKQYACARIEITPVEPKRHGANERAIREINKARAS